MTTQKTIERIADAFEDIASSLQELAARGTVGPNETPTAAPEETKEKPKKTIKNKKTAKIEKTEVEEVVAELVEEKPLAKKVKTKAVSVEVLRAALIAYMSREGKEQIDAIQIIRDTADGAEKIRDIAEDKYQAVIDALEGDA